jgi:Asp-tRNA(Asn)/Glu-tRNA(Gln) amidotransferase A subunit family amidase
MLLDICLRRIAALDSELRAWVAVDPLPPTADGPLRGIPFGVKDIFETAGLPTEYGSALYSGRIGTRDAAVVAHLRHRGAVIVGKTQTAAFASFDPPPTGNPNAPGHTPGGSSSGSAAAVASGMVPFALGTQTLGSVLRPASYCGVCGFKPTYNRLSTEGVLPFAPSLDTVGFFTEDAVDMEVLWALAFPRSPGVPRPRTVPDLEAELEFADMIAHAGWLKALRKAAGDGVPITRTASADGPWPRAAFFDLPVTPEMRAGVRRALDRLTSAGMQIDRMAPPPFYNELLRAALVVNTYEGARSHETRWRAFGGRIGGKLAELVERGLAMPEKTYRSALEAIASAKGHAASLFRNWPIVIAPAATGGAPKGLDSTGDPSLNAPWTALGVPAISIPIKVSPGCLPLGLQIVAPWDQDEVLLAFAVRSAAAL